MIYTILQLKISLDIYLLSIRVPYCFSNRYLAVMYFDNSSCCMSISRYRLYEYIKYPVENDNMMIVVKKSIANFMLKINTIKLLKFEINFLQ